MKKICTILGSFAVAGQLVAGVVAYVDFEGAAGDTPEKLSSIDKKSYIRFPENSSTKSRTKLSADVPEALKASSGTSAEINGSFAWLKGAQYQLSKDFSLNFWFKLDAEPVKKISFGCFGCSLRIGYNAAAKRFFIEDFAAKTSVVSGETPLGAGAWHMLTVTVAGKEATFYLDGKAIGQGVIETPFIDATDGYFGIDSPHGTIPLIGKLDDVVLCDHILDAAAIGQLYSGESPASWLGVKKK